MTSLERPWTRYPCFEEDTSARVVLARMGGGADRRLAEVRVHGLQTVIPHVFPPDCPYLEIDAVFGVKETLIGDFCQTGTPEAPEWRLDWDFTLAHAARSPASSASPSPDPCRARPTTRPSRSLSPRRSKAPMRPSRAGAAIVHAHVRNDDESPSSDPERFARLQEGIAAHCPGTIIQFSTGGRSGAGQARGAMLPLRPDMASLSVGSNNFPTPGLREPARPGRLACGPDAGP